MGNRERNLRRQYWWFSRKVSCIIFVVVVIPTQILASFIIYYACITYVKDSTKYFYYLMGESSTISASALLSFGILIIISTFVGSQAFFSKMRCAAIAFLVLCSVCLAAAIAFSIYFLPTLEKSRDKMVDTAFELSKHDYTPGNAIHEAFTTVESYAAKTGDDEAAVFKNEWGNVPWKVKEGDILHPLRRIFLDQKCCSLHGSGSDEVLYSPSIVCERAKNEWGVKAKFPLFCCLEGMHTACDHNWKREMDDNCTDPETAKIYFDLECGLEISPVALWHWFLILSMPLLIFLIVLGTCIFVLLDDDDDFL